MKSEEEDEIIGTKNEEICDKKFLVLISKHFSMGFVWRLGQLMALIAIIGKYFTKIIKFHFVSRL